MVEHASLDDIRAVSKHIRKCGLTDCADRLDRHAGILEKLTTTLYQEAAQEASVETRIQQQVKLAKEEGRRIIDNVIMHARIHKMEANGYRMALAQCYQAVSRKRGERGLWNGSDPVVHEIERLEISADWWKGRCADVEADLVTAKIWSDILTEMWLGCVRNGTRLGIKYSQAKADIRRLEALVPKPRKETVDAAVDRVKAFAKRLRVLSSH
jgi:hypothetical protein